ncbi:MAG: restriction system protein, partial [Kiritimatiellia bacterium]
MNWGNFYGEIFETIPAVLAGLDGEIWLLLIVVFVLSNLIKNPRFIGFLGESGVRKRLSKLDPKHYTVLHNVLLDKQGDLTQIDHIVVSIHGVLVIETKAYKGWIFGSEKGRTWTQTIYKKKSTFQNPLRQNYKHLKSLEVVVGIPMRSMLSVVVFTGDCTFKTDLPPNVMKRRSLLKYIRSLRDEVLRPEDVAELARRIKAADCSMDKKKRRAHLNQ